jgi:glycosyltransferase involved in cell wall biosynthesis
VNLAIVSKYPPISEGVSDYGRHVAASLARRSEVRRLTVLANVNGQAPRAAARGVQLRRVWRPNEAMLVPRLIVEILQLRPDAIWYNVSLGMFGGSALAAGAFVLPALTRRLGIRSIVTLHEVPSIPLSDLGVRNGWSHRVGVAGAIRLLRQADVLCVTIDRFRRRLDPTGVAADRIVHLPLCGYDEPQSAPFEGPPVALLLTSLAPHKGIETLLEAFSIARRTVSDGRLAIAGIEHPRFPGYSAALQRHLADVAGVDWLGAIPDDNVREVIQRSHVVVAPYLVATGSSATIHRALALGRPVIATDLPEFRAMAREEDVQIEFVPASDPLRLARALELLWTEPARSGAIVQKNLISARRHSLAATTDAYVRLLAGGLAYQPSVAMSRTASGAG